MQDDTKDLDFVLSVVKSLVDHPEAVSAERTIDERGVLITLKVDPQDMGQIIGRQGQTARALRTLLRVVGAKNNARVNLKIYEPEGSRRNEHVSAGEHGDDMHGSNGHAPHDIDTSAVDFKL